MKESHKPFQVRLNQLVSKSKVGQEIFGMVLARTSLRAPAETSRWHLEKGDPDGRPVDRRSLPQATISKAVGALMIDGLLEDGETLQRTKDGRPVSPLRLGRNVAIAGVHVEQRNSLPCSITTALVGLDSSRIFGKQHHKVALEHSDDPWEEVARKIYRSVTKLHKKVSDHRAEDGQPPLQLFGVGVEVGAPIHRGRIMQVSGAASDAIDFTDALQRLFAAGGSVLGSVPVVVENDVNALAVLASHQSHYAVADLAVIGVFDEGVGGGLVMDGRLRRGGSGTAMEIGHLPVGIAPGEHAAAPGGGDAADPSTDDVRAFDDRCWCGQPGHVDTRTTPSRICGQLGVSRFEEAANDSSPEARETFRYAGSVLGRAVAHACNVVNPSRVVIYLPAPLCEASEDPESSTAASAYLPAAKKEIVSAFANAVLDPQEYLRFEQLSPSRQENALLGAKAAAICVLESFIEHALRVDGCGSPGDAFED